MPTYDYTCEDCKARFEIRMSITAYSEGAKRPCASCGSENVVRAFTSVNVLTSGRGTASSGGNHACGPGRFT